MGDSGSACRLPCPRTRLSDRLLVPGQRRSLGPGEAANLIGLSEDFDFGEWTLPQVLQHCDSEVGVGAAYHVLRTTIQRNADALRATAPELVRAAFDSAPNPDAAMTRSKAGHETARSVDNPQLRKTAAPNDTFGPARSKLEAVTRLSSLTHSPPESLGPGKGTKVYVLLNLAADLDLPVDTQAPKPVLGEQIAATSGVGGNAPAGRRVAPSPSRDSTESWTARKGASPLSVALPAGTDRTACRPRRHLPGFTRARAAEAVTNQCTHRLRAHNGWVPGARSERARSLTSLGGSGFRVDSRRASPRWGPIAGAIGATWDERCWSAGHTITLEGLNPFLEAAERFQRERGGRPRGLFLSVRDERCAFWRPCARRCPWTGTVARASAR